MFNGQALLEDEFEYYDATPPPADFLTGDVHQQLSQLHFLLGEVLQTATMGGGTASGGGAMSQQQQGEIVHVGRSRREISRETSKRQE